MRPVGGRAGLGGVELQQPAAPRPLAGQLERHLLLGGVQQRQQAVVEQALAALVDGVQGVAAQHERQRGDPGLLPVLGRHLLAVRPQPRQVLGRRVPDVVADQEARPLQDGVAGAQLDQPAREVGERPPPIVQLPVDPRQVVVLAVGVVVAALGAAQLVARQQHGDALREEQRGQQVPHLPVAQRHHLGVVGLALDAVVPGLVVVGAVAVALAVGVVVLALVGDEVVQREAVVRGDEVDAGLRLAALVLEQVGRAGEAVADLRRQVLVPLPVAADGVAELPVPLAEGGGEVAHLVAAEPRVPGLGDQLHAREHRILADDLEDRREGVEVSLAHPAEDAGQIEAEAVDVHVGDPGAQRVDDQPRRLGVGRVQAVAGPGEVEVVARVRHQPVVGGVVDAAEAEGRSGVVALAGVVVDDVQDHLEAGGVQRLHHALELAHGALGRPVAGVAALGREVAEGAVAPVVAQAPVLQEAVVAGRVHRHELHRRDAQPPEVADHGGVGQAGVGAARGVGHLGVQLGQALHVRLVEDGLAPGHLGRAVVAPVEDLVDDHRLGHARRVVPLIDGQITALVVGAVSQHRLLPVDPAPQRPRVRIDEQLVRVAALAPLRGVRAVNPQPVQRAGLQARGVAVEGVPRRLGEVEPLHLDPVRRGVEQADLDAGGDPGEDGEVDALAIVRCASWIGVARPDGSHS